MRVEPNKFAKYYSDKRMKVIEKIIKDEPETIGELRRSLEGEIHTDSHFALTRMLNGLVKMGVIEKKTIEDSNRHIKPKKPIAKDNSIEVSIEF